MRLCLLVAPTIALLSSVFVRAEDLPTFHVGFSSYKATHIVLVNTEDGGEGRFRVVESWKGDLKKDTVIRIPALAKDAKGDMVLFLRHDPTKKDADQWQPTGIGKDWNISVAWLDGDTVSAVDQQRNPGPAEVVPISYIKSRKAFKEAVEFYVRSERTFDAAKAIKDADKRVAAFAAIINGNYDRKEEAFAQFGLCGPKAVPVLVKVLEGTPTHDHKYAVTALAAAGGKDAVPLVIKMIEAEVAYWAKTGPKLESGWWFNTDGEAWKRHGKLIALLDVYGQQPTEGLRKQVVAVRDLMRNLPVVDSDRGIPSLSMQCEKLLKDSD